MSDRPSEVEPLHIGELPGDDGLVVRDENGLTVGRLDGFPDPEEMGRTLARLEGRERE